MRQGTRILLVEDDDNSARLVNDFLASRGAHITRAGDGLKALEKIKTDFFDLVIIDLRLPGHNGFTLTEYIRKRDSQSNLPVVVTSAFSDRQNRLRAFQAGADSFLSKPLDLEELFLSVNSLVSRRHKQEANLLGALHFLNESLENRQKLTDHSRRIEDLCMQFSAILGLQGDTSLLREAAKLHDIGALCCSNEAGHCKQGARLLSLFGINPEIIFLIERHHDDLKLCNTAVNDFKPLDAFQQVLALAEKVEEVYRDNYYIFLKDAENGLIPVLVDTISKYLHHFRNIP